MARRSVTIQKNTNKNKIRQNNAYTTCKINKIKTNHFNRQTWFGFVVICRCMQLDYEQKM